MKKSSWKIVYFVILLLFVPKKAFAMHIMEGFLPIEWAIFWWAITLAIFILGFRSIRKGVKENPETKMMLGSIRSICLCFIRLKNSFCYRKLLTSYWRRLRNCFIWSFCNDRCWIYRTFIPSFITRPRRINNSWCQCLFYGSCRTHSLSILVYKGATKMGWSFSVAVFLAAAIGDLGTYVVDIDSAGTCFPF